jgi:hypothetical protein
MMKGDIALAGFVLTAEEWQELEPQLRLQLIVAATKREDPWVVAGLGCTLAEGTGPHERDDPAPK